MADLPPSPPGPPRPRLLLQPPPLPRLDAPGPIPPEPFLDLTDRAADTLPGLTMRPPPPEAPLTEATAQQLRRELALHRESMPTIPGAPASLPPSDPASIRTRTKRALALQVGKYSWWSVASFLLTMIGAYVARRWPDYANLSEWILGWLP